MKKLIVIVGPTGVGKTALSISLAKLFDGEIINADSTQVYKTLDIATAKVTEEEKQGIIHHLIDIKNIEEDYTVYDYQLDGKKIIDEILKKNKTPIIVGGTGLYIKALLFDYKFKEEKKYDFSKLDLDDLYDKLLETNPNTNIHKNNRKRVERALEYFYNNNENIEDKNKDEESNYDYIIIGLTTDRKKLYEKINNRVDQMINNGLIEEAQTIYNSKIRSRAVLTPIGYKEMFDYFDKVNNLEETIDIIKQKSRNYAKKQYTWFNNQMNVNWFNVDYDNFDNTICEITKFIKKS